MAEYIEREAVIDLLTNRDVVINPNDEVANIREDVECLPAADVRPVVLCRDCKYAQMTIDGLCKYCDRLTEIGVDDAVYLSEDFFCAAGEKREES